MTRIRSWSWMWIAATLAIFVVLIFACKGGPEQETRRGGAATGGMASAAAATFVPPGDLDELYLFYSGGHSGQVYVAGIPSMRHISTIPVFAPYPATGLRLRRRDQGHARRLYVGRRPPPVAVAAPTASTTGAGCSSTTSQRPPGADLPARLQDQADLRPHPQRLGQPRRRLRHRQYRVHPLMATRFSDSDPQGAPSPASTSTPPSSRASWRP